MRERTKESQRGARRWLTQADIAAKYSAGRTAEEAKQIAQEIVDGKESDHHMKVHHIRPHPDAPTNSSMRLFLIWDESLETTEKDSIVESLFECKDEDDQDDGKKRKRDSKGKSKKKKARTSSSSGSSDSDVDSDSSSSSSHAKKKSKKSKTQAKKPKGKQAKIGSDPGTEDADAKPLVPGTTEKTNKNQLKLLEKERKAREKEESKEKKRLEQEEKKEQQKALQKKKSAVKKAGACTGFNGFHHNNSPMGPWEHFQPVAGCKWTLATFDQHPEHLGNTKSTSGLFQNAVASDSCTPHPNTQIFQCHLHRKLRPWTRASLTPWSVNPMPTPCPLALFIS